MHTSLISIRFCLKVDAALDNVNVTKTSNYIRSRAHEDGLQCIVISLKDTFYTKADALVGIYRDQVHTRALCRQYEEQMMNNAAIARFVCM